jgi:hypothetical protein
MLAEIYLNSPLFLKTVIVFGTFIAPVACVAVCAGRGAGVRRRNKASPSWRGGGVPTVTRFFEGGRARRAPL